LRGGLFTTRIFDNIDEELLSALQDTVKLSEHGDFCVGYFNLRGWKGIDGFIDNWKGGDGQCCRLLIGMQKPPDEYIREALSMLNGENEIDQQTAIRLKKQIAEEFRNQLTFGLPTNADEAGLRKLAKQIKAKKVVVKLFLRYPLHAKLYLLFRPDPVNPRTAFVGSSNLTFAGLSKQGEMNVDVLDHDATQKLAEWFEMRWNDRFCIDISKELVEIIEESWAKEKLVPPYHVYLKMAYHLAQEARTGLAEFKIPKDFGDKLFDFQVAAVKIAAHHLNRRNGVLIGDVVGLGKTLMATALTRIFEDDYGYSSLIICPKNLVKMWEDYRDTYRLRSKVLSLSKVQNELPDLRRYNIVLIDESHNLRNRDGKRYRALQEYILGNESKVILLTATPYNKTYLDLSNQLRLFISENDDIGIRPENLLNDIGETEFLRRHQCPVRSLPAFENSDFADDWRELMRLYMVRRTRSFIKNNYAYTDCPKCKTRLTPTQIKCPKCEKIKKETDRRYLLFEDGSKSFFPTREPLKAEFSIDEKNKNDQYAKLYADDVVDIINNLELPRYGLGTYRHPNPEIPPSAAEDNQLEGLSRAKKRLVGFCRTNIFKRLESSGKAFILTVQRHILRDYVYLYAVENNLDIPIGTQEVELLDSRFTDQDVESIKGTPDLLDVSEAEIDIDPSKLDEKDYKKQAEKIYKEYVSKYKSRFKWIRSDLFVDDLNKDLKNDAESLMKILRIVGTWDVKNDEKLNELYNLISKKHPDEKILIFSQFADTVNYLEKELTAKGVKKLAGVTGSSKDPTSHANRFSPISNKKRKKISEDDELRVLIATDVLSEGQNLQDGYIVVNYDLPWAIIRLVQRAGRVDRIGQTAEQIVCYSFLPAKGVERIIRLRKRLRDRLKENAEVIGADEAFFEDDDSQSILDLYNEKAGILDGEDDSEVDLASFAYQIWINAITEDPKLEKIVPQLQNVSYATRSHKETNENPNGVLLYVKTAEGNDALAYVDKKGKSVTESQYSILKMAKCDPDTPAIQRMENHHKLVKKGVEHVIKEERSIGGQLGRPSGARFRTYERLKKFAEEEKGTLYDRPELHKAIEEIYRYPLKQTAKDTLNRQLRSGVSDDALSVLVSSLSQEDRLCIIHEEEKYREPQIICSMGLKKEEEG
jgi:superfamily II DNA helicase RecQ